jgi:membrane protein
MGRPERGRRAEGPGERGAAGWKGVAGRVVKNIREDQLTMVAAGVAFYGFFALFPALAALVSLYGLFSDPGDVEAQVTAIGEVAPEEVTAIVGQQLDGIARGTSTSLGWGVAAGLFVLLWSAKRGMGGLVQALNVAYGEGDRRGFVRRTAVTFGLTIAAVVATALAIGLVVLLPAVFRLLDLGGAGQVAATVGRWLIFGGLVLFGLAALYRYAPARENPRWRWVSAGSILAAVLLLVVSAGLSIYVSNFGRYTETFGALAAVAVLLLWFYLSAFAILVGAEVNAEVEKRSAA